MSERIRKLELYVILSSLFWNIVQTKSQKQELKSETPEF